MKLDDIVGKIIWGCCCPRGSRSCGWIHQSSPLPSAVAAGISPARPCLVKTLRRLVM